MKSKFLLVTRIGMQSRHSLWMKSNATREFDVLFSAYDASVEEVLGTGVHFEFRPGKKIEGYGAFLQERRALWEKYHYICFWDDDLEASASTINRMFAICDAQRFKIAQPSLTGDSSFTFAALLRQAHWNWRYINGVEMMCPIFRHDALAQVSHLFRLGYESGIDLIWCNLLYETPRDFAVIDSAPVRHSRPVGTNRAENGFLGARKYEDDIYSLLEEYQLPWLSFIPYSAITYSGREIRSRALLLAAALCVLAVVPRQRPFWSRLRTVLVYLKHLCTRRAQNIRPWGQLRPFARDDLKAKKPVPSTNGLGA